MLPIQAVYIGIMELVHTLNDRSSSHNLNALYLQMELLKREYFYNNFVSVEGNELVGGIKLGMVSSHTTG
jgi:hypothetical protein